MFAVHIDPNDFTHIIRADAPVISVIYFVILVDMSQVSGLRSYLSSQAEGQKHP
jgi:hypothetical protein